MDTRSGQIAIGILGFSIFCLACEPLPNNESDQNANSQSLKLRVLHKSTELPAKVNAQLRITHSNGSPVDRKFTSLDFELTENDNLLSVEESKQTVERIERPIAQRTLLLLDMSGNIFRQNAIKPMLSGAQDLVFELITKGEVAVYAFDGGADLIPLTTFTQNKRNLEKVFTDIQNAKVRDPSSNLNGAIVSATNMLMNTESEGISTNSDIPRGALILFTSGTDRAGRTSDYARDRALNENIDSEKLLSFAISLGDDMNGEELNQIGRHGAFVAKDKDAIESSFVSLADIIRKTSQIDYRLKYCSLARSKHNRINIRIRFNMEETEEGFWFDASTFGGGC